MYGGELDYKLKFDKNKNKRKQNSKKRAAVNLLARTSKYDNFSNIAFTSA